MEGDPDRGKGEGCCGLRTSSPMTPSKEPSDCASTAMGEDLRPHRRPTPVRELGALLCHRCCCNTALPRIDR